MRLAQVHSWFGRELEFEPEKVVNVCHRSSGAAEQWRGLWLCVERAQRHGGEAMSHVK